MPNTNWKPRKETPREYTERKRMIYNRKNKLRVLTNSEGLTYTLVAIPTTNPFKGKALL